MTDKINKLASELHRNASRYGTISEVPSQRAAQWMLIVDHLNLNLWKEDPPRVSATPEGEVVLEWWSNSRKVSVYFGEATATMLRIWGPNITTEMSEEDPLVMETAVAAWKWLRGELGPYPYECSGSGCCEVVLSHMVYPKGATVRCEKCKK
jgi:hypothetical protein